MEDHISDNPATNATSRRKFLRTGLPLAAATLGVVATASPAIAQTPPTTQTVNSIGDLRLLAVPSTPASVIVLGFKKAGDGGGGTFFWNSQFVPNPASGVPDDGGTIIIPNGYTATSPGRWLRVFSGALNPKWFGALGNNTERTPQNDGVDISSAPWNVWPAFTLDSNPYNAYPGYGPSRIDFTPISQSSTPFQNTMSWDSIGIQLALFSVGVGPAPAQDPNGQGAGEVAIPGGIYQLSQFLYYTNAMRATLSGAGMLQTILTKTPGTFDNSSVLDLYRIGGTPTTVRDLGFSGPKGGGTTNFSLIRQMNTNGVHIERCWLTVCQKGIDYSDTCSDSYVTDCSAEFCETVLNIASGSELIVESCNFWQSGVGVFYTGIQTAGNLYCVGNRFIGFQNYSINSTGGYLQAADNNFSQFSGTLAAIYAPAGGAVISGNHIVGGSRGVLIDVGANSAITGNYVEQQAQHACLNIHQGASRAVVSGNTFICNPNSPPVEGGAIISVQQGSNYNSGCSECLISNNITNLPNGINVNPTTNTVVNNLNG